MARQLMEDHGAEAYAWAHVRALEAMLAGQEAELSLWARVIYLIRDLEQAAPRPGEAVH